MLLMIMIMLMTLILWCRFWASTAIIITDLIDSLGYNEFGKMLKRMLCLYPNFLNDPLLANDTRQI